MASMVSVLSLALKCKNFSDMLEDMESNLEVMSLFFDSFITTPFYELIKTPICGVTDTVTTVPPVTTAAP